MRRSFTYRRDDARHGSRWLLVVTIVILAVFAVDIASHGLVRASVRTAGSVIWRVGSGFGHAVFDNGYFTTHAKLAEENDALRAEIASYQAAGAESTVLADENAQLRAMLHLESHDAGVAAPVVSSYRASPYGTFTIGTGTKAGVANGSLVLTSGGFVLGRVVDAGSETSLVQMIFAPGSRIDVVVKDAAVTASGRGGGNARAAIPRAIHVDTGEPVIAPELGQRPVGLVASVAEDAGGADQIAYISLPINISTIRYVYVITAHE
jgi:cell shape-determining protein MreC